MTKRPIVWATTFAMLVSSVVPPAATVYAQDDNVVIEETTTEDTIPVEENVVESVVSDDANAVVTEESSEVTTEVTSEVSTENASESTEADVTTESVTEEPVTEESSEQSSEEITEEVTTEATTESSTEKPNNGKKLIAKKSISKVSVFTETNTSYKYVIDSQKDFETLLSLSHDDNDIVFGDGSTLVISKSADKNVEISINCDLDVSVLRIVNESDFNHELIINGSGTLSGTELSVLQNCDINCNLKNIVVSTMAAVKVNIKDSVLNNIKLCSGAKGTNFSITGGSLINTKLNENRNLASFNFSNVNIKDSSFDVHTAPDGITFTGCKFSNTDTIDTLFRVEGDSSYQTDVTFEKCNIDLNNVSGNMIQPVSLLSITMNGCKIYNNYNSLVKSGPSEINVSSTDFIDCHATVFSNVLKLETLSDSTFKAAVDVPSDSYAVSVIVSDSLGPVPDVVINDVNIRGFENGISYNYSSVKSMNIDGLDVDCTGVAFTYMNGAISNSDKQSVIRNIEINNAAKGIELRDLTLSNTSQPLLIEHCNMSNVLKGIGVAGLTRYIVNDCSLIGQGVSDSDGYAIDVGGTNYNGFNISEPELMNTASNIDALDFYTGIYCSHGSGSVRVKDSSFKNVWIGSHVAPLDSFYQNCTFVATNASDGANNQYGSGSFAYSLPSSDRVANPKMGIYATQGNDWVMDCVIKGFDYGIETNAATSSVVGTDIDVKVCAAYSYLSCFIGNKIKTGKYGFVLSSPNVFIDNQMFGPGKNVADSKGFVNACPDLAIYGREMHEIISGKPLYGEGAELGYAGKYLSNYYGVNKVLTDYLLRNTKHNLVAARDDADPDNTGAVIADFETGCKFDYNFNIGDITIYNCGTGISSYGGGYASFPGGLNIHDCDTGIAADRIEVYTDTVSHVYKSNKIHNCNVGVTNYGKEVRGFDNSGIHYDVPLFDLYENITGLDIYGQINNMGYASNEDSTFAPMFYVHNNKQGAIVANNYYEGLAIQAYDNDKFNIKVKSSISNSFNKVVGFGIRNGVPLTKTDSEFTISDFDAKASKSSIYIGDTDNLFAFVGKDKPDKVSVYVEGNMWLGHITGSDTLEMTVDNGVYKLADGAAISFDVNTINKTMLIDCDTYSENRVIGYSESRLNTRDISEFLQCVKPGWVIVAEDVVNTSGSVTGYKYVLKKGHIVTFDCNDGSKKTMIQTVLDGEKVPFYMFGNSRDGGNFIGWGLSPDSTTPITDSTVSDDTTYYAIYKTLDNSDYLPGLPASNFDVSWSVDDDSIASIDNNGVLTGHRRGVVNVTAISNEDPSISKTVSVEIKGTQITYDYATNGGTSVDLSSNVAFYKDGTVLDLSPVATKPGYEFVGWNTDKNATTALDSYSVTETDTTLYAIYKKDCSILFHTWDDSNNWTETVTYYNNDATKALLLKNGHKSIPSKYEFAGFNLSATNNTETIVAVGSMVPVSQDVTDIYCVYKVVGNLNYVTSSGDIIDSDRAEKYYVANDVKNTLFDYVLKAALNKAGYKFIGWKDAMGLYDPGVNFKTTDFDHSLEADYEQIMVESIRVTPKNSEIKIGDTVQLTAVVEPEDALDKSVTWSSSDTSIASVDKNGLVTAHKDGQVTIMAKTNDGSNLYDTATVNVYSEYTVTYDYKTNGGTSVTKTSDVLRNGSSVDLSPVATKPNWKFVGWNTDKNATTAMTELKVNGSNVTVYAIFEQIKAESISVTPKQSSVEVGTDVQLTAKVLPEDTTDKSVTWSSSDESVATVDENGLVKTLATGSVVITATTNDGSDLSDSASIDVYKTVEVTYDYKSNGGVSSTKTSEKIKIGDTVDLTPVATKPGYEFVGWNTDMNATTAMSDLIADGDVTVYAVYKKTVVINYHTYDSKLDYKDTCDFYNNEASKEIDVTPYTLDSKDYVFKGYVLDGSHFDDYLGDTMTVTPDGANVYCTYSVNAVLEYYDTDKSTKLDQDSVEETFIANNIPNKFTYTLKDHSVKDGYVFNGWKPFDDSESAYDPGAKYSTNLLVMKLYADVSDVKTASIAVTPKESTIYTNETVQLTAKVLPEDSADKTVKWTSSDESIATVDANGLVTAVSVGDVTITASVGNGDLYDTAVVHVIDMDDPVVVRKVTVSGIVKFSDGTVAKGYKVNLAANGEIDGKKVSSIATVKTDNDGIYSFVNIIPGEYKLSIVDTDDKVLTTCDVIVTDKGDKDVINVVDKLSTVTVSSNVDGNKFTVDAVIKVLTPELPDIPSKQDTPSVPKTGDNTHPLVMLGTMFASLVGLFTVGRKKRKHKDEE